MIRLQDKSSDIGLTLIDVDFEGIYPEYSARIEHDVVTFYHCNMIEQQFPRGAFSVEDDTEWTRGILLEWADSDGSSLLDIDTWVRFE